MECSAIEPARSLEVWAFNLNASKVGLSPTPPQDIVSVKELWTPQALAMKREEAVSDLDISKYKATLKGTSKEKLSAECK